MRIDLCMLGRYHQVRIKPVTPKRLLGKRSGRVLRAALRTLSIEITSCFHKKNLYFELLTLLYQDQHPRPVKDVSTANTRLLCEIVSEFFFFFFSFILKLESLTCGFHGKLVNNSETCSN